MPSYAFLCTRCSHATSVPMSVETFRARVAEAREKHGGLWPSLSCPRCGRFRGRGKLAHDFVGQARTQKVLPDEYTFYENAPDDILQGQHRRTVTKSEARVLLAEHQLVDAGLEGKLRTPDSMLKQDAARLEIEQRWKQEQAEREEREAAERARLLREEAERALQAAQSPPLPPPPAPPAAEPKAEAPKRSRGIYTKAVDKLPLSEATIPTAWPALKAFGKRLGISVGPRMKKPVLERLIRAKLKEHAAAERA